MTQYYARFSCAVVSEELLPRTSRTTYAQDSKNLELQSRTKYSNNTYYARFPRAVVSEELLPRISRKTCPQVSKNLERSFDIVMATMSFWSTLSRLSSQGHAQLRMLNAANVLLVRLILPSSSKYFLAGEIPPRD